MPIRAVKLLFVALLPCALLSVAPAADPLPGTQLLTADKPLDVLMVEGIDRFCLKEIEKAREQRDSLWKRDYSSLEAYEQSLAPYREKFRALIGAVDPRVPAKGLEFVSTTTQDSLIATAADGSYTVHAVRWPVLDGVTAEGLFLKPKAAPVARVIALPDADWMPEMIAGLAPGVDSASHFAAHLVAFGCEVLVPTLISRDDTFSGSAELGRFTNQTHREWVYRSAFELGRHVIGYEVQKVLAAVDQFTLRNEADGKKLPIAVMGVSEGGLLALYSAALDTRIDGAVVSGYFKQRDGVWQEPIYRNVWGLLREFGDADIASMIAPRLIVFEKNIQIPVVDGPPKPREGRSGGAAPGRIEQVDEQAAEREYDRLARLVEIPFKKLKNESIYFRLERTPRPNDGLGRNPMTVSPIQFALEKLGHVIPKDLRAPFPALGPDQRKNFSPQERQQRQVRELIEFTQKLLRNSFKTRDKLFAQADRSSVEKYVASSDKLREQVYQELIGKLPDPTMPPNPRSRKVLDEKEYTGYEVVLDTYPDVIAAGILLLPTDLKPNEKRPVVVCQHGLEGVPMDTITGPGSSGYPPYKAFSAELAKRGFIVYAPQNPYRGKDLFRTLQRKSNPLGRSLFSYIIPQHLVTLRWLATLPNADKDRLAFYGLSYGGKTAVRVPPMLPPSDKEPGYCLSICSADYNEWVSKNASTDMPFSYVFTGEYEIFEWNMGHVANYAELSMLMTPRPFMVERGHDDGVGIDEWVAFEYAKVRRHYNKLGLGDKTEIEFFNGPHTINGQATYEFLHRHLNWPKR